MYFTTMLTLLPRPIQKEIKRLEQCHHRSVEYLLDNPDKTNLVMGIVKKFPDLVRKPDGKRGWDITLLNFESPLFTIYCCVQNFSDISPISEILTKSGYPIDAEASEDNKYNMSRKYIFRKGSEYSSDKIHVVAYALKELGASCRAVSIGYSKPYDFGPVEQYRLVCDDLEATAVAADIADPNYL